MLNFATSLICSEDIMPDINTIHTYDILNIIGK